jgi:hypothetical protein
MDEFAFRELSGASLSKCWDGRCSVTSFHVAISG